MNPEVAEFLARTMRPVHRCKPHIFESMLLHSSAMSRHNMDRLADPNAAAEVGARLFAGRRTLHACLGQELIQHHEVVKLSQGFGEALRKVLSEYVVKSVALNYTKKSGEDYEQLQLRAQSAVAAPAPAKQGLRVKVEALENEWSDARRALLHVRRLWGPSGR